MRLTLLDGALTSLEVLVRHDGQPSRAILTWPAGRLEVQVTERQARNLVDAGTMKDRPSGLLPRVSLEVILGGG